MATFGVVAVFGLLGLTIVALILPTGHPLLGHVRRLMQRWRPPPPTPPPPVAPEPEPLKDLLPLYGNIPRQTGEGVADLGDCDEFPPQRDIRTRYQEFNWRLISFLEVEGSAEWPVRMVNDYPLHYRGRREHMLAYVHSRVRPGYPVIIDWDGLWHSASVALERTPDLRIPLIEAYFAMPGDLRPVIVSRIPIGNEAATGTLTCMRYGFVDYRFPIDALAPYTADGLAHLFRALAGPADGWMWFSVARLRHAVIAANKVVEALRIKLEEETAQEEAVHYENRFATLWKLRQEPAPSEEGDAEDVPPPAESAETTP